MSKLYLPTSEQMDTMNGHLAMIAAAVGSQVDVSTWAGIQKAVRLGIAPDVLPVGTQLQVKHSTYGTRLFNVVAHDYLKNVNNPDGHTMTIMQHDLLPGTQFDAPEAFYYADKQLAAGTYYFNSVDAYDQWLMGTYKFTLAKAVPAGGQLCITGQYPYQGDLTKASVVSYSSRTSTTVLETAAITTDSGGTNLGTWGKDSLNHIHRIAYGSNNYKESAIRQFLNSSAAAGSVWTPQTKFDRPPSWVSTLDGYKKGFDQDFLAAICPVILPCAANNKFEAPDSTITMNTKYALHDEFYLASAKEVFNKNWDVADDTVVFPFYDGATDADRIKYRDGSAADWWLRTPASGNAYGVRLVSTDGTLSYNGAYNAGGLAPACTIG